MTKQYKKNEKNVAVWGKKVEERIPLVFIRQFIALRNDAYVCTAVSRQGSPTDPHSFLFSIEIGSKRINLPLN